MKLNIRYGLPLAALGMLALTAWALSLRNDASQADGLVYANGRLESDRTAVASKVPGRIVAMLKQEGDPVTAGEVIARLDTSQIQPKLDEAKAAVQAVTAQLDAKRAEIAIAKQEAPLGVAASVAAKERADAQAKQTARDAERLSKLLQDGAVDPHHAEEAALAATAARTQAEQADHLLAQARLAYDKVSAKETELGALVAQLAAARAQQAEAQSLLDEAEVRSPNQGVIAVRAREPGEVLAAGSTLYELYDASKLYLKAYVPETDIGRLHIGQEARVWVDAAPQTALPATLTTIASRAEFTPKEVETRDERAKQVFAVKLQLAPGKDVHLAPGLPADAAVRYRPDAVWRAPK